jgi:LmbE family N-acetylglucosaminyl deacetylase
MNRRVLAIGAHPDDVEFGAGGTLLKHGDAGDVLHILVLTRGESGSAAPEVRRIEAEEAAGHLGAGITVADLQDTRVEEKAAIDVIEAAAGMFRPDVVYTHSVHDTHQDHRAAAHASRVALRSAARKVYAYQSPSTTEEFRPARFPDIGLYPDEKMKLIEFHKSQSGQRRYLEREYVQATARYWGVRAGLCEFAEALEVIIDRDWSAEEF